MHGRGGIGTITWPIPRFPTHNLANTAAPVIAPVLSDVRSAFYSNDRLTGGDFIRIRLHGDLRLPADLFDLRPFLRFTQDERILNEACQCPQHEVGGLVAGNCTTEAMQQTLGGRSGQIGQGLPDGRGQCGCRALAEDPIEPSLEGFGVGVLKVPGGQREQTLVVIEYKEGRKIAGLNG